MKVLHIGDRDLICRRFNGYDYHDPLFKRDVDSSNLVMFKSSNSDYVHRIKQLDKNFTKSIIKDKLFINADIIHFHLIHNTPFDINYMPVITKMKPTVLTLHDSFFMGGHCIYHYFCEKWHTQCYDCQYIDKPFAIKADDTALEFEIKKMAIQNSNITAVVASKWMEEKAKKSPIWNEKNIYMLPFGINQTWFTPGLDVKKIKKSLGIDDSSIVLMFRASSNPYKGLDIIKESLQRIKANRKITLIILEGKGFLDDLKDKFVIKEYKWINKDSELALLYQSCDIFLMPSEQEAFGLMAVEAMSCAKMVLSTKGTALETIINAPECGIVTAHNHNDYADELQRLLENDVEIKERGKKSFEFAKNNYNQDVFIEKLINIYKNVITEYKMNRIVDTLTISQLMKYQNNYKTSKLSIINASLKHIYYAIKYSLP
jgi:glycosyltransferase involved in cell wall biosynthesis